MLPFSYGTTFEDLVEATGSVAAAEAMLEQYTKRSLKPAPRRHSKSFYEQKLSASGSPVRLLYILPGSFGDELCCELRAVSLTDRPRYHALSYSWGEEPARTSITLNGLAGFPVTQNLERALQHLRDELSDGSHGLWVDAICINQEDTEERNRQVSQMRLIYETADQVLIWLGDVDLNNELNLLMGQKPRELWTDLVTVRMLINAIDQSSRVWWRRVWIVQEFAHSRRLPVVISGLYRKAWPSFVQDVYNMCDPRSSQLWRSRRRGDHTDFQELSKAREYLTTLGDIAGGSHADSQPRQLLQLLEATRSCSSTDPRDRVFALVGLTDEESIGNTLLRPDYSRSTAQVFAYAAYHILSSDSTSFHSIYQSWSHGANNMPTWVPDFSAPRHMKTMYKQQYSASWPFETSVVLDSSSLTLTACGVSFDKVGETFHLTRDNRSTVVAQLDALILSAEHRIALPQDPRSTLVSVVSLERMLVTDDYDHLDEVKDCDILHEWRLWEANRLPVARTAAHGRTPSPNSISLNMRRLRLDAASGNYQDLSDLTRRKRYMDRALATLHHRTFFTTDAGFCGIGPADVQAGDRVVVLLGASMPYVLRPVGDHYTLVGEAYVSGIMYGELMALVGTPDGFDLESFSLC